ncbi:WD40-repeat-containing domain protein [Morchella snyderi]|nr:WD40-repeat-containing domain protein [Morchella snyderi]
MATLEGRQLKRDFISELPLELSRLVLSLLDIKDIFTCSAVSRTWRSHTLIDDSLYIPHLLRKYNNVTHGRDPIPPKANTAQELLRRFPRLSASSYFSDLSTLRDLALRDLYLLKQWNSGNPWRKTNLNVSFEHADVLLSALIDPVYSLVISGDRSGKVVFWSTQTEKAVSSFYLGDDRREEDIRGPRPAASAMALAGDHLVIGTWHMMVHIARRDEGDVPVESRAFSLVASFPVPSPVVSILLEGTICIVGCHSGEISFWDIGVPKASSLSPEEAPKVEYCPKWLLNIQIPNNGPFQQKNLSMHYRKPFLFTSSNLVSQVTPSSRKMDRNNKRDLWEYGEREITIKSFCGSTLDLSPEHLCLLHPSRDEGDLFVAWPDFSVYSVGGFNAKIIWTPKSDLLVGKAHDLPVRCLGATDGFLLTGSFDHTVRLFGEDGTPISEPFEHRGDVNALAVDPCFFASVSDDKTVMLWDFTSPAYAANFGASLAAISDLDSESDTSSPSSHVTSPPSSPEI